MFSKCRVLDLSDEKGQLCGKVLADLGCDVVKVEPPGGDPVRRLPPFVHDTPGPESGVFWQSFNVSKRSVTLNIEASEGRGLLLCLIQDCDILVESFAPGRLPSLGCGYGPLSRVNPGLIMASITPFGQEGPYRDFQASDLTVMALGGVMAMIGDRDRAPLRLPVEQWHVASFQAVFAILVALFHRELTGEGQHIDVSMQDSTVRLTQFMISYWNTAHHRAKRGGTKVERLGVFFRQFWQCKDGTLSWRILTASLGSSTRALVDWMKESGFDPEMVRRVDISWEAIDMQGVGQEQVDRWEGAFDAFFMCHTKEEIMREALRRGIMSFVDNCPADLLKDPQLRARGLWQKAFHEDFQMLFEYPGLPFKLQPAIHSHKTTRAPRAGEHNDAIYAGQLGLSNQELARLAAEGII